ncbi:MAG: hypothetical protein ACXWR0_05145 [Bdellovibrio sp.]
MGILLSTARKINTTDSDQLIGLPSEICGFKDGIYYPPKSFRNFGTSKNDCYNGLFYLLGNFKNSKDFKIYKSKHKPEDTLENPLIIQIYVSILGIQEELRKNPKIVFGKKDEYSIPYKGKINFSKTIVKNNGLIHKTFKTVNELHTRSLERFFLFLAFRKLPSLIDKYIPQNSKNDFYRVLSECNSHLIGVDSDNQDLNDLSMQIIRKPIEFGENSKLISHCKVIAEFILENLYHEISGKTREESPTRSKIEYHDFHLNLNRPFEKLLKEISRKLPKSDVSHEEFSKIQSYVTVQKEKNGNNQITGPTKGEFKHSLIPDVWKVLNVGNENDSTDPCLLILDAKHKEFANLDNEMNGDDPFVQYNRITRNDLHQLITYIRTNLIDNVRGIFGFFGFIQESLNDSEMPNYFDSFIECNRDISDNPNPLVLNISEGGSDKQIYINILGVRFGSVLSFIGEACDQARTYPTLLDDLYCRLAIELTHCLFKDDIVDKNKTFERTLNSCLDGASRSLFYVYKDKESYLSDIGHHIAYKFLKLSGKFEIKKSKVALAIAGKFAPHIEVAISEHSSIFIIDSSEDPRLIFDSNIGSDIFDRDGLGLTILLSRNGLVVYKNGIVGESPSIFFEGI